MASFEKVGVLSIPSQMRPPPPLEGTSPARRPSCPLASAPSTQHPALLQRAITRGSSRPQNDNRPCPKTEPVETPRAERFQTRSSALRLIQAGLWLQTAVSEVETRIAALESQHERLGVHAHHLSGRTAVRCQTSIFAPSAR